MNNTITILEKDGQYGIITIDTYPEHDVLGEFDTKKRMILRKKFENPIQTDREYKNIMKVVREKSWNVIYCGERMGED